MATAFMVLGRRLASHLRCLRNLAPPWTLRHTSRGSSEAAPLLPSAPHYQHSSSSDTSALPLQLVLPDHRCLSYALYGACPAKATAILVYLHGWCSSRLESALLHPEALRQSISVVAVDRPGSGASTFNPGGTFNTFAGDMEQLLDHLQLRQVVLLGSSGGSPFAAACAALLPGRVAGLVLACPLAPMYGREAELQRGMAPAFKRLLDAFCGAPWAVRLRFVILDWVFKLPEQVLEWMGLNKMDYSSFAPVDRQAMAENSHAAAAMRAAVREGLRQGTRGIYHDMLLFAARPWTTKLEAVCCPAAVWVGEEDVTTPSSMAQHYSRRIPGALLHIVPGEGHLSLPFNCSRAILQSVSTERGSWSRT